MSGLLFRLRVRGWVRDGVGDGFRVRDRASVGARWGLEFMYRNPNLLEIKLHPSVKSWKKKIWFVLSNSAKNCWTFLLNICLSVDIHKKSNSCKTNLKNYLKIIFASTLSVATNSGRKWQKGIFLPIWRIFWSPKTIKKL